VTAAFAFLLIEAGLAVRDVRTKTVPQVTQAATDIDRTAIVVGGVATNIERSTRSWQAKQNQLAESALQATNTLNSDLTGLGTLLSTANFAVSTASNSASGLSQKASEELIQLQVLSSAVKPILTQISATMQSLSVSSQSLSETLTASEPHLIATTANLDASSADVKEVTDHYKQTLLHPVKSFWHGVRAAFDLTVEILEAHAYFP